LVLDNKELIYALIDKKKVECNRNYWGFMRKKVKKNVHDDEEIKL
jgi:hypothetical protein